MRLRIFAGLFLFFAAIAWVWALLVLVGYPMPWLEHLINLFLWWWD